MTPREIVGNWREGKAVAGHIGDVATAIQKMPEATWWDKFQSRVVEGLGDAARSKTNMRNAYQDRMGIGGGVAGSLTGTALGSKAMGQAFGEDKPGSLQALQALELLRSGTLPADERKRLEAALASHVEQTKSNEGSGMAQALAALGVAIPTIVATTHPVFPKMMAKLVPNEKLATSNIVRTKLGRNTLAGPAFDASLFGPVGATAGAAAYKATEKDDYTNPFG
jgi:hypothetical protein